ncbi:MAG: flagellar basal body-associated FliL family protein [Desulfobulbaceae bacterium]|nr:flagellar basal body-associated FliL family protein [Desulfobulbaceae bacterium]
MAADSDSQDPLDFELPEGLDDDLGGDWESAFQAEDFMLSPDEEPEDFFIKEEGLAEDMDLASLLDAEDTRSKEAEDSSSSEGIASAEGESKKGFEPLPFFRPIASFFSQLKTWFTQRPPYQKIILSALPLVVIIVSSATLFFRSTSEDLAGRQSAQETSPQLPAEQEALTDKKEMATDIQIPAPVPRAPLTKLRKKWALPAFIISVPNGKTQEDLIIRVDITLILRLDPGQPIPEHKRVFLRDAIYQFYTNRPVEELERYPLARGEMIRKLNSWLDKQWPQNSISTIMFNRYQLIK